MERPLLQRLDMFNTRLLLALAFAAIVPTSIGCAPPSPGEEVGDSYDNLTGNGSTNADSLSVLVRPGNIYDDLLQASNYVFLGIKPGTTTKITNSLNITVAVNRSLSREVKGCAGGFSTAGLSSAEILAKDDEILRACANPVAQLEGREGWNKFDKPNNKAYLTYNATPFVTENQHIVFAFALNGKVQTYIFEN
jgi:hypothetical protein